MKSYIQFLMLLGALSGGSMAVDVDETERNLKSLALSDQVQGSNLDEDEIERLGEKILSGNLDKRELERYDLQEIADWIQDNMYRGVVGFYSNNQFVKMARELKNDGAVNLEYDTATVGKKGKKVEYISRIVVVDPEITKSYLQNLSDSIAEHNRKYPYH